MDKTNTKVADMTVAEFEMLLEAIIDRKLREFLTINNTIRKVPGIQEDTRTFAEIQASIERHRWTPPAGAPTSAELIGEDRDNDEPYR